MLPHDLMGGCSLTLLSHLPLDDPRGGKVPKGGDDAWEEGASGLRFRISLGAQGTRGSPGRREPVESQSVTLAGGIRHLLLIRFRMSYL